MLSEGVTWVRRRWGSGGLLVLSAAPLLILLVTGLWKVILALVIAIAAFLLGYITFEFKKFKFSALNSFECSFVLFNTCR